MRKTRAVLLGTALCLVWAGCEERDRNPFVISGGVGPGRLEGLWTGSAEITAAERTTPMIGTSVQDGFAFPVSLELGFDRRFTLRSFGYPTSGSPNEDRRFCSGVYAVRGNAIEFFPNDVCPALPLFRYNMGRSFPSGLELEARTRPGLPGQVYNEATSVRVHFHLRRDVRFDPDD